MPAGIVAGTAFTVWGSNRFLAVAIPASLTGYLFFQFGHVPIVFFEQLLLAQPEMPPGARTTLGLQNHRPNMGLLFGILVGIVTVPILVSTTVAILLLTIILAVVFQPYFFALINAASRGRAVGYLLAFSYQIVVWVVNYPEVYESNRRYADLDEWVPPFAFLTRARVVFALMASLYVTLLIGLSYYCPWEIFAKLSTDLPYEVTNNPSSTGYGWLFAPFFYVFTADPIAVYLLTFVFGLAGFVLIPPAILLAIYMPRIVELERIRQQLKVYRSTERR